MKKTKRWVHVLILALTVLWMGMAVPAASLSARVLNLRVGDSYRLSVNGAKGKVKWSSSKKKIAAVSKKGVVKAKTNGTARITAKAAGKKYVCKVTVRAAVRMPRGGSESRGGTGSRANAGKDGKRDTGGAASSDSSSAKNKNTTPDPINSDGLSGEELACFNTMVAFRSSYPEGMTYTNDNYYQWKGGIYRGGYGCAGFAFMLSDAYFGSKAAQMKPLPGYADNIRVGDIIRLDYNTHSVIVLRVNSDHIIAAEANYNKSVHWGRKITFSEIKTTGTNVLTRYTGETLTMGQVTAMWDFLPDLDGGEESTVEQGTAAASEAENNSPAPEVNCEPKQEAPKQEAPQQEAPKQEAPQQEAPKQEAPQQEAPKQEAPQQEAPKQEAPQQEAPKQEAPQQEAPKQEEPVQEVPKQEEAKQETAVQENPVQPSLPQQDEADAQPAQCAEPAGEEAQGETSAQGQTEEETAAAVQKEEMSEADPSDQADPSDPAEADDQALQPEEAAAENITEAAEEAGEEEGEEPVKTDEEKAEEKPDDKTDDEEDAKALAETFVASLHVEWVDQGGALDTRPGGIFAVLVGSDCPVNAGDFLGTFQEAYAKWGGLQTLSEANGWTITCEVPSYERNADGTLKKEGDEPVLAAYTWLIENVVGYDAVGYGPAVGAITALSSSASVTLTLSTGTANRTSQTVIVEWDDDNNTEGYRPASVNMTLSSGQAVSLTADNSWTATVGELPLYQDAERIEYSWVMDGVPYYQVKEVVVEGTQTTFTLMLAPPVPVEKHQLTIRYLIKENGKTRRAFQKFVGIYETGNTYNVKSPALAGYEVSRARVRGTIQGDTTVTVYYTAGEYTLRVRYVYGDGTQAAADYETSVKTGGDYSVDSPAVAGYTPSRTQVAGQMEGHDTEVTVYYTPVPASPQVQTQAGTPAPEQTQPQETTVEIDEYQTPLGLGALVLNAGDCFE